MRFLPVGFPVMTTSEPSLCPKCHAPLEAGGGGVAVCPGCLLDSAWFMDEDEPPLAVRDGAHAVAESWVDGRYLLKEKLGEGGFATVWRAVQHEPVQREVALKLLKPELATRQVMARFQGEWQALARMQHPGIEVVYDAGESGGLPWFAAELVDGLPVTEYCRREGLDAEARCRVIIQICDAVQHAHGRGVIHRDLKPANVLAATGPQGVVVKVIDFGVARALAEPLSDGAATAWRQLIGTPGYMSPEQADPSLAGTDVRTDVHALGTMLYELLAGGLPFPVKFTSSGSPARRLPEAPVPQLPAGAVSAAWRRDLRAVLAKALAHAPAERYASAEALAADLQRVLKNEPVEATPHDIFYVVGKLARRHRTAVTAAASAVVCLLAGLAASVVMALREQSARSESEQARLVAEDRTSERTLALARADAETAQLWKSSGQAASAVPFLCRSLTLRPDAETAADLMALLAQSRFVQPLGEPVLLAPEWGPLGPGVLSGDGSYAAAAFGGENPSVACWSVDTGAEVSRQELPEPAVQLDLAVGARRLVVVLASGGVMLSSPLEGRLAPLPMLPGSRATKVVSSVNGRMVVVGTDRGEVWLVEPERGGLPRRGITAGGAITQIEMVSVRNTTVLVAATSTGEVWRWVDGGVAPAAPLFKMEAPVTALQSLGDGGIVAAGDAAGHLTVAGVNRTIHAPAGMGHAGAITALALSNDGRNLGSAGEDGLVRAWPLVEGGAQPPPLDGAGRVNRLLWFPPDADMVVISEDSSTRVWRPLSGTLSTLRPSQDTRLLHVTKGPQLMLAAWGDGSALRVLRLPPRRVTPLILQPERKEERWNELCTTGSDAVAAVCGGTQMGFWNTRTLERTVSLTLPAPVLRLAPTGDGGAAAALVDGRVLLVSAGGVVTDARPLAAPSEAWEQAVLAPAAQRVVFASHAGGVHAVDWKSGGRRVVSTAFPEAAALSVDGGRIALGMSSGMVHVEEWAGGNVREAVRHPTRITALAFSPTGLLASGSTDGMILLWDAAAWVPVCNPLQPGPGLRSLAFSPDGSRCAAGLPRGVAVIAAPSGRQIGLPIAMNGAAEELALGPEGDWLVSGGMMLHLWPLPPRAAVAPPWFTEFATGLSAMHFSRGGMLEPLPARSVDRLAALIPEDDASPAAVLARWLISPVRLRTVQPWHAMSGPDFRTALLRWGTPSALREARALGPAGREVRGESGE